MLQICFNSVILHPCGICLTSGIVANLLNSASSSFPQCDWVPQVVIQPNFQIFTISLYSFKLIIQLLELPSSHRESLHNFHTSRCFMVASPPEKPDFKCINKLGDLFLTPSSVCLSLPSNVVKCLYYRSTALISSTLSKICSQCAITTLLTTTCVLALGEASFRSSWVHSRSQINFQTNDTGEKQKWVIRSATKRMQTSTFANNWFYRPSPVKRYFTLYACYRSSLWHLLASLYTTGF